MTNSCPTVPEVTYHEEIARGDGLHHVLVRREILCQTNLFLKSALFKDRMTISETET